MASTQPSIAALTHVRKDDFFLERWVQHYQKIVGRENLYVILDGSDWQSSVDLGGIHQSIIEDAPRGRNRNDMFMARRISRFANETLSDYDLVIRSDVDEFLICDTAAPFDFTPLVPEVEEHGYVHALGIDLVHNRPQEPAPLLVGRAILNQRRFGLLSSDFSKPSAIRPAFRSGAPLPDGFDFELTWSGGFHRLKRKPMRLSQTLVMVHLALCDFDLAQGRHASRNIRGKQHRSFAAHQDGRMQKFNRVEGATPQPFDEAAKLARNTFQTAKVSKVAIDSTGTKTYDTAQSIDIPIEIPARFYQLI